MIPPVLYSNASEYKENNDIDNAISTYSKIRGFKNSSELVLELEETTMRNCQVGGEVYYGAYETNGGFGRQKIEPIKWIVLVRDSEKVLLISKDCLTAMSSKDLVEEEEVIWRESKLDTWLNREFVSDAFTDNEKDNLLVDPKVKSKVFVLSRSQIEKYLSDSHRQAKATALAKSKGIWVDENGYCCWLEGNVPTLLPFERVISSTGRRKKIHDYDVVGIRPAVWIKLNSSAESKANMTNK